jgi:hypothetical protein
MRSVGVFPFGRPNTERPALRSVREARLFVLGVYPSALHVRWRGPKGSMIEALAVDAEPTVFWTGSSDEDARARLLEGWRDAVGFDADDGAVSWAQLNGSSGKTLEQQVLVPLDIAWEHLWATDCFPWFLIKSGPKDQGARILDTYDPFALNGARRDIACLLPRPRHIATLIDADRRRQIRREIAESRAAWVMTLGQEAADVLAMAVDVDEQPGGLPLRAGDPEYGTPGRIRASGHRGRWLALAHPGATRQGAWANRHAPFIRSFAAAGGLA